MESATSEQTCSQSGDRADVINTLIEECAKLSDDFKDLKSKQKYYMTKRYALSSNVLVKRIKFHHEKKWEAILKDTVAEVIGKSDINQQELQILQEKRNRDRVENCQKFSTTALNYGNNFSRAQAQYSSEILTQHIHDLRDAADVLEKNVSEQEKQLYEEERKYASEYLNAHADGDESKLDMVLKHIRSINKHLHNIISNDNQVQELQSKINLRKDALARYKAKAAVQLSYKKVSRG